MSAKQPILFSSSFGKIKYFFVFILFVVNTQVNAFLADDFNDGVINTTLWKTKGNTVYERNGVAELRADQTDNTGVLTTANGFTPKSKIRLELKHMLHSSNDYFFPAISFSATDPKGWFNIMFGRSAYAPDYCNNPNNYNKIYFWSDSLEGVTSTCTKIFSNLTTSNYLDKWIISVVEYDMATGKITLDIGGDGTIDATATVKSENRFPIKDISIGSYGWWTGHWHKIDYVKVTGTDYIQYTLSTNVVGSGSVTGAGTYASGTTVTLTATPNADSTFTGWSPNSCANSFAMPANNLTCTANFALKQFAVSVNKIGNGTVGGSGSFAIGSPVNLTATPDANSTFVNWTPSPCNSSFTMPANNLTCTANFALKQFAVSVNKIGNGTVGGSGNFTIGSTVNLTATPDANSTFVSWTPSPCNSSFTMPVNNLTCTANFALKTYQISTSANNGVFSPANVSVEHGKSASFSILPEIGYFVEKVEGCGGSWNGNNYITDIITNNCSIIASLKLKSYTITTAQTANGKIEPVSLTLEHGKTTQFTLTPDIGYEIDSVQGCEGAISPQRTVYTILPITKDCQITTTFKRKVYPVTVSVNPPNAGSIGGFISPIMIKHGESASFKVTPANGYETGGLSGCNAGLQSGDMYTTGIITNACDITVNFITKNQISITTKVNGNGSIDPQGKSVDKGGITTFTLIPKIGYEIDSVSGCNGSRNIENNTFTTGVLNDNCEITANFRAKQWTVSTKISDKGGSFEPMFAKVESGNNTQFILKPDTGYEIDRAEGCGGHLQGNNFTTNPIENNCEVIAYFKLKQWTVTGSINTVGGLIKPLSQSIQHGQTAQFDLVPDAGYEVSNVTGSCNGSQKENSYITNAITSDCSVIASFKIKKYSIQTNVRPSSAGFIKPSSNSVEHGNTVTFSVTPTTGYKLELVRGCKGESIYPVNGIYTSSSITDNCTLSADFSSKRYNITLTHQYIDKPPTVVPLDAVEYGQTTGFDISPQEVENIVGCGGSLNSDRNHYTTGAITNDCEITVFYKSTVSQCTTFGIFDYPQVFVPCVKVGDNVYKAGMSLIPSSQKEMRFEVDMNTLKTIQLIPDERCAVFPAPNTVNRLRLNCLDVGNDKYWVEMNLVNNPNVIQFDLFNYGLLPK